MDNNGIGTQILTQVGLVVHDIERALDAYCDIFGIERPTVSITDEFDQAKTMYSGKPTYARAKLAFLKMGQVEIELIEPVGEPSTWKDALDQHGYSVHHIAFHIKDTDKVTEYLLSKGLPVVQQGHYTGGMYSYIDSEKQLGLVLELLENFD